MNSLEYLYIIYWCWIGFCLLIPQSDVRGILFERVLPYIGRTAFTISVISIILLSIAVLVGTHKRSRQCVLIFNIGVLFFVFTNAALTPPIGSGAGYLVILLFISIVALWCIELYLPPRANKPYD